MTERHFVKSIPEVCILPRHFSRSFSKVYGVKKLRNLIKFWTLRHHSLETKRHFLKYETRIGSAHKSFSLCWKFDVGLSLTNPRIRHWNSLVHL